MSQAKQQVQWILREAPDGWERLLPTGMPPILGRLLAQRGIGKDGVDGFLRPRLAQLSDPFEIPEVDLAVKRIFQAIDQKEKVCIFGDYDVDGVSSITILQGVLEAFGLQPFSFIPRRSSEGYGLSDAGLSRCLGQCGRPDLLISVDCGTVSNEAIASLKRSGVDTVVVDHHEIGPDGRPDCVALVNPKASGDPRQYLCAAGVVFKLAHALLKRRPVEGFDLKSALDLVAVATVSDIVPLVEENRLLVRHGLRILEKSNRPGLKALLKLTGTEGRISSSDIGFRIGPRLNAAGRMDQPERALAALMTECDKEASDLADELEHFNRSRQQLEQVIFAEAMAMIEGSLNDPVIVVGSRSWHAGIVGIVASRLMRMYHKPVFVISIDGDGVGKGSGRSIAGVSLVDAIRACRDHLISGGGHHMAAGLSIREEDIAGFRQDFIRFVREHCDSDELAPKVHVDAEVKLADICLEFLSSYELLQPFGSANPQPTFMARNVWLADSPKSLKNNHLRLILRQDYNQRTAIFFGGGAYDLPDPPWDIAFTVDRNFFRGRTSIQISIQNVRSAERHDDETC